MADIASRDCEDKYSDYRCKKINKEGNISFLPRNSEYDEVYLDSVLERNYCRNPGYDDNARCFIYDFLGYFEINKGSFVSSFYLSILSKY